MEIRIPTSLSALVLEKARPEIAPDPAASAFGFRFSFGIRISAFGF
jgi:hypothetical protein